MKHITYTREASRYLRKVPKNWQQRIFTKIEQYATDPESLSNNVIRMKGESYYRLRVGDYRVIFDEFDTVINIIRVDSRGSIYEK